MRIGAWAPAVATLAAGTVHAFAGGTLAAGDPIEMLLGRGGAAVIAAAVAVVIARLFLIFVAPAWTAYVVGKALLRATTGRRSSRPASRAGRSRST
jgi:hypothetical protein